MIKAVCFDVGEVLVDETREYGTWADWLGVPRHTFSAVFGAVIASGQDYRQTFQILKPGFDLASERQKRIDAGRGESFSEEDVYDDVHGVFAELRSLSLKLGIAGNQTARAGEILIDLFAEEVDAIDTSESLGIEKPNPEFMIKAAQILGVHPEEVLYVGDRADNDLVPAQAVGMLTAHIRRGPWALILEHPAIEKATFRIESLSELPQLIAEYNLSS